MKPLQSIDRLIVHHSASPSTVTPEEVRHWHLDKGWDDVGYHWLIDHEGQLSVGRPLPNAGAHALGNNHNSLGICVIGDNTSRNIEDHWNPDQYFALLQFILHLRGLLPDIEVFGHRDVATPGHTQCPGVDVRAWLYGR